MLKEQIEKDLENAKKARAKDPIDILTELVALIGVREKTSKSSSLTDKEVLDVIKDMIGSSAKMLKIRENKELEFKIYFLSVYLPKKLTDDKLEELIYTMFVEKHTESETLSLITEMHNVKYIFNLSKLKKMVQTTYYLNRDNKGEEITVC